MVVSVSRLSLLHAGAVPVQIEHYGMEIIETIDILTHIFDTM